MASVPSGHHLYEESRTKNAQRHNFEMPDFDTFWQQGYTPSPAETNYTYLADFRADPDAAPLKTESGRIVLTSELLTSLDYDDCCAHPAWMEPLEWLGAASASERFHLISNQPPGRLHSQLETGEASLGQKQNGREVARLSPQDASRLELKDGGTIKIWNDRGACLATVRTDEAVRQGVLVLPTEAWLTQAQPGALDTAGNPNVLTPDIPASRFSQGCAAYTCLVSIEPVSRPNTDALTDYKEKLDFLSAGRAVERSTPSEDG